MRLRTLPVSGAGVLAAWSLALHNHTFKVAPAVICLVFALLCQIASNFANEYYDYRAGRDSRGRSGPRRGVTEGEISPQAMKTATFATLAVAAMVGLSLVCWGGWWLVGAGVLIGTGALAYSAGPWPLSTHCLGEAAVFVFFGLVPVVLTYYVQALATTPQVWAAAAAIGLMGCNVLVVNNYRDIPDDRRAGKHTLATTFGRPAMVTLYCANALAAASLWMVAWNFGLIPSGVSVLFCLAAGSIAARMSKLEGATLNPLLGQTAMAMFAVSLLTLIIICFE